MAANNSEIWVRVRKNVRNRMISGVLLLMPFGVTLLMMRWLFHLMAGFLKPIVKAVLSTLPPILFLPQTYVNLCVSLLSVVILLVLLYLVGAVGQFVLGKRLISSGETLVLKIPLVRTIYTASKQVMQAISMPDRAAFKSVVLVEFPRPGFKAVGFFTGYIEDNAGKKYCKVFIPTTPNVTTGFFELVPAQDMTVTDISLEDAFKMIISGGIVSPSIIESAKPQSHVPPDPV